MSTSRSKDGLAEFLGWFSLGLGVPQVTTPGRVNQLIGVEDTPKARAWQLIVGIRELAAAAGILSSPRPVGWLWARVGGDVMDLALLGSAFRTKSARPERLAVATASVAGIMVADVVAALRHGNAPEAPEQEPARDIRAATTIRCSPDELERFWRDPGSRDRIGARMLPADGQGAEGPRVRFVPAPGGRGTEVHVELRYEPTAGAVGLTVAKLLGDEPEQRIRDDLRRIKQVLETGIVVRSEGTPEGPLTRRLLKQRPAQPPPEPVGVGTGSSGGAS
jgi:hypothetical protein